MNPLVRLFAAVGALALIVCLVSSCALAGSPAAADPAEPTLESIAPPAPVTQPAQSNPAPAVSTVSDETAIRQVIAAMYAEFNAQNFEGMRPFYCAAKQPSFSPGDMRATYATTGGLQVTVTAVAITGDIATVPVVATAQSENIPSPGRIRMVREGGSWKMCGLA